ncbi:GntR family transcriptional regulator [Corynebacterium glyciniphilum]|uniref:GntR family transcriptional regulator n=1 Tax=Corynebacterium glyciniphilum TaxID=1404244 RepID=UPI0011AB5087|nr:GntR family transcriptional regulator [Corynebacterium glyciniphilum]
MAEKQNALLGLKKTNLREQALSALRTAITRGELRPRSALIEMDLSERLGISRGTLREALRQLQQEGLVVSGARGRLSVRSLEPHEVREIFAVRSALEGLAAAELAIQKEREEPVAVLRSALDRMAHAGTEQLDDRIEFDLSFHRALCELTGNATLLHSWISLEGSIRMSIMYAGVDRAVGNMDAARHMVIVEAIEDGDPEAARLAVAEHLDWAADNLVT